MKLLLTSACVCLCIVLICAPPPFGIDEANLSEMCRRKKCATKNVATNLSYPMDCLLYISCDGQNEEGKVEPCPDDLVFNERIAACDTPQNAKCLNCWEREPEAVV